MSAIAIHPTHNSRPTADPGALRLTRRGRVVVFVAGLLAAFALAIVFGAGSVATQEPGDPVLTEMHTVSGGESLWMIADRIDDTGHTAEMVDRIEQMNGLESANLMVGQQLRVPVADAE